MHCPSKEILPLFLKWAGGKLQLIKQFENLFPSSFNNYCEPFVGSGAVFFHIKSNLRPDKVILSDINEDLINCFVAVRDSPCELIELLFKHKNNHSRKYYYAIRSVENNRLDRLESAARLIYLNKSCFNGLYRVNSKGEFNVPFGDLQKPRIFDKNMILQASQLLQGVELQVMSFEKVLDFAERDDFVYLDPPYIPLSKTSSFTRYSKGDFSLKEQKRLSEVFRILDSRGCFVMLSNSDHPLVKELYGDYKKYTVVVRAKRMINSVGNRRGPINEIVVRNYSADTVGTMSLSRRVEVVKF
jgi:DNA adenine methylase